MSYLFIILAIILAFVLFVILKYNSMIQMQNRVKEGWADIDVQLKRRYNLIPNLVETVKGYASHEQETLTRVTEARNMAINASDIRSQGQAENMLSGALKSLFAVAESYPDLKANQNFLQLQNELVDTEDKIQAARRFYNGMVRDFNTLIQKFPSNIIANMFKFMAKEFFELEDETQRANVEVSFKAEAQAPSPAPVAQTPAAPAAPQVSPVVEAQPMNSPAPAPTTMTPQTPTTPVAPTATETQTPTPTPPAPAMDMPNTELKVEPMASPSAPAASPETGAETKTGTETTTPTPDKPEA